MLQCTSMNLKPVGAQTPEEYLDQIDEPRRTDMVKLHQLILDTVPELTPSIQSGMIGYGVYHYKYASGREGHCPVIALASQKQYISVYVSATENGEYIAERSRNDLPKANIGKSCIRFKRLSDIDIKVLTRIVKTGARLLTKSSRTVTV